MPKLQPSVLRMTFDIPGGLSYVDLSQCASVLNRRFYRQGLNWAVSGITLVDETSLATGGVEIEKLPNTWVMGNSWMKGFSAWKRQQDQALEDSSSGAIKGRFNDFKIHMDQSHISLDFANNLLPRAFTPATAGEWLPSEIVIPNYGAVGVVVQPEVTAVGASNLPVHFSLVDAYANSRAVPQSPDPSVPSGVTTGGENVYKQMFDVGDNADAIIDNAVDRNNDLPYDQDQYPGDGSIGVDLQTITKVFFTSSTISSQNRVSGFNAPCGLIRIDQLTGQALVMYIDLVPGNHRGYLAQPMQDM